MCIWYLDSPLVTEKIEWMLEGYRYFSPLPMWVIANFWSLPNGYCQILALSDYQLWGNTILVASIVVSLFHIASYLILLSSSHIIPQATIGRASEGTTAIMMQVSSCCQWGCNVSSFMFIPGPSDPGITSVFLRDQFQTISHHRYDPKWSME